MLPGFEAAGDFSLPGDTVVYSTWQAAEMMREVLDALLCSAGAELRAARTGKEAQIEFNLVLIDRSYLRASIPFSTDWVLLRDAARALMKVSTLICDRGICTFMGPPGSFLARMNKPCIGMAAARRRPGGKKQGKTQLWLLKTLSHAIAALNERRAQSANRAAARCATNLEPQRRHPAIARMYHRPVPTAGCGGLERAGALFEAEDDFEGLDFFFGVFAEVRESVFEDDDEAKGRGEKEGDPEYRANQVHQAVNDGYCN